MLGLLVRLRRVLQRPLCWNCLQQILSKILPANKSLSFEGKSDSWKLSRELTCKEPCLTYKVWVVRLCPKQSVTPSHVGLSVRCLSGRAVARTGHTTAGAVAVYTLGFFVCLFGCFSLSLTLFNRNKNTVFENSGS